MGRKPDFEMPDDIPSWLMTFSDVITLLMTFFILLLTFATNQPETFERVQLAMFSGGGAAGIVGPPQGPLELDSIITRIRPRSGRITKRGAEIPPINSNPSMHAVDKGLKGLEEEEDRDLSTLHAATIPIAMLVNNGETTREAATLLRVLSSQMRKKLFNVQFLVEQASELDEAHILAWALHTDHKIDISKIGIGRGPNQSVNQPSVTIILNKPLDGEHYGR